MAAWCVILNIILALTIIGFCIGTIIINNKNGTGYATTILYPFSTAYSPVDPSTPPTIRRASDGQPQIQCPAGMSINIVGATFDIADPYGECANTPPSPLFSTMCKSDPTNEMCQFLSPTYNNTICQPGSQFGCVPRNASAWLADACNGQQTCDIAATVAHFGPYPCEITPPNVDCTNTSNRDTANPYCELPYIAGWEANQPPSGSSTPNSASQSLGYQVHGIYTCVPNSE